MKKEWKFLLTNTCDNNVLRIVIRRLTQWAWSRHLEDRMDAAYSAGWSDRSAVNEEQQ